MYYEKFADRVRFKLWLIPPHNGLVGFTTAIINDQFKIGNVAIYTSPDSRCRLVFPNKVSISQVVDRFTD